MIYSPLKFKPIYQHRLWGGDRLKRLYQKNVPKGQQIGESWELADLREGRSVVAEGSLAGYDIRQLLTEHGTEMGFTAKQCEFPFGLLIKFLDADDVLSVQVHPDQKACRLFPGAQLKTECWYVIDADADAVIYRGLKPGVGREELSQALSRGNVEELMEVYPARRGDFHFLPAGTVHALGAGLLVAEIQTPSDTTYRLYDWQRTDKEGKSRELHIEEALASIHYTAPPPAGKVDTSEAANNESDILAELIGEIGTVRRLIECPYFNVVHATTGQNMLVDFACPFPLVMMVLSGKGRVGNHREQDYRCGYRPGDTILLPAMEQTRLEIIEPGECLFTCLGSTKAKYTHRV